MKEAQDRQDAEELKSIDNMVAQLRYKYDSVSILVTRQMGPEDISIGRSATDTRSIMRGAGDWFARYGHLKIWLLKLEEEEKEVVRKAE